MATLARAGGMPGAGILALLAILLLPPAACSASDFAAQVRSAPRPARPSPVRVWSEHGLTRVEASGWAGCTSAQAWDVILDYPALPRYMPSVDSSRVLRREGETVLVHQVGSGRFLIRRHFRFDLEFRRQSPETVGFRQVRGDFREFGGRWSVVPESGGVRISFSAGLRASVPLPGFLLRRTLRRQAEMMLPALTAEIGRRYGFSSLRSGRTD